MSSEPLIVEALVRKFGERLALNGAGFTLQRGEFLALLGPNGAGKTTLIRIISGRLKADGGRVLIHGQEQRPGGNPDVMSKLGIIPQNIALYDQLTARENLELFGKVFGVSSSDLGARIDEALVWTGLQDRSSEPVSKFSGGMQRRLNIACGVLHRPDIILLDEPTVGVDPQSRQRIWEMLKQLQSQGVSIVLTTHQLDEAQQICDRIVIMDGGRTIASGTFDQLLENSIGRRRRVVFALSKPAENRGELLDGFQWRDDRTAVSEVDDVVTELPARLKTLSASGLDVVDLSIETPSLQSVFLHYTGHELRESGSLS